MKKYKISIMYKLDKNEITLYSKKSFTEEEFRSIVLDVFNENKEELVLCDLYKMEKDGIYIGKQTSDKAKDFKNVLDKYIYINTLTLTNYIIRKYPEFVKYYDMAETYCGVLLLG